jgi:DNA-binding transcriptional ArsR family regulator
LVERENQIYQKEDKLTTATAKRAGQRGKSIEEVVAYAVSHRTRVQILIVLNQGTYTAGEIADIIEEPLNKVANHIRELVDAGSIEVADSKRRRNTVQYYYRAVRTPYYSKQDIEAMTWQQRQVTAGLVIQSLVAETMAGLWAGKMHDDPGVWLAGIDLTSTNGVGRNFPTSRKTPGSGWKRSRRRQRTASLSPERPPSPMSCRCSDSRGPCKRRSRRTQQMVNGVQSLIDGPALF